MKHYTVRCTSLDGDTDVIIQNVAAESAEQALAAVESHFQVKALKADEYRKMTIHGHPITQKDMDVIGSYMDDETRETVHAELAPCTPEEFLLRYLELDPCFYRLLVSEFNFKY